MTALGALGLVGLMPLAWWLLVRLKRGKAVKGEFCVYFLHRGGALVSQVWSRCGAIPPDPKLGTVSDVIRVRDAGDTTEALRVAIRMRLHNALFCRQCGDADFGPWGLSKRDNRLLCECCLEQEG